MINLMISMRYKNKLIIRKKSKINKALMLKK